MDTPTLQILKLDPKAKLPVRQTSGSAGYDLYSLTDGIIETQSRLLIPTGIAIKLPANTVGLILAILFLHEDPSIIEIIAKSFEEGFLSKLISLGAIMNLLVFFVYIKKKQDYRARGVLMATIVIAIITLILNII